MEFKRLSYLVKGKDDENQREDKSIYEILLLDLSTLRDCFYAGPVPYADAAVKSNVAVFHHSGSGQPFTITLSTEFGGPTIIQLTSRGERQTLENFANSLDDFNLEYLEAENGI